MLTFLVNGLVGILLVSTFGISFEELAGQESALPVSIVGLTGLLGLLLIVITQMRINTVNLYLASSNLQSFFSRRASGSTCRARSGSSSRAWPATC